jgi:hypothetical protein
VTGVGIFIGQNYWVFGLCLSHGILETREQNVSETGPISVLRWGVILSIVHHRQNHLESTYLYAVSNVSGQHTASIFTPKFEARIFLRNVGNHLPESILDLPVRRYIDWGNLAPAFGFPIYIL